MAHPTHRRSAPPGELPPADVAEGSSLRGFPDQQSARKWGVVATDHGSPPPGIRSALTWPPCRCGASVCPDRDSPSEARP